MNRILNVLIIEVIICILIAGLSKQGITWAQADKKNETNTSDKAKVMKIKVKANGNTTVFELNNSQAARDLYVQLPLSIKVENYGSNEKIFYPPRKLNTSNTPLVDGCQLGTLAYYAPWGDVVMFYGSFGSAPGLYLLGNAISGSKFIQGMSGTIQIGKG